MDFYKNNQNAAILKIIKILKNSDQQIGRQAEFYSFSPSSTVGAKFQKWVFFSGSHGGMQLLWQDKGNNWDLDEHFSSFKFDLKFTQKGYDRGRIFPFQRNNNLENYSYSRR